MATATLLPAHSQHGTRLSQRQRSSTKTSAGAVVPAFNVRSAKRVVSCKYRSTGSDYIRDYDGGYGARSRTTTNGNGHGSGTASAPPPAPSFNELLSELEPAEAATVKLFRDSAPSVVNVSTSVSMPFNLFGMPMQMPRGVGSGFVWDTKGHVLTNNHVVASSSDITITLSDGTQAKAKVVGRSREKDIAVLQLQGLTSEQLSALRPLPLGVSSNLLVGQRVYAIGNPFGLDLTLTSGLVSGLGREVPSPINPLDGAPITDCIQTDAAINPGNSGGPLLDSKGRVVAINTAILDPTGRGVSSGVGFAIPIDAVKGMVEQILTYGRVIRPALGISIAPVSAQVLQRLGFDVAGATPQDGQRPRSPSYMDRGQMQQQGGGVLVATVRPGGPADVAGLRATRREMFGPLRLGDIIVGMDGKPVRTQKDLFTILDTHKVGDTVQVTLFSPSTRNKRTVFIVLADREKLDGSE